MLLSVVIPIGNLGRDYRNLANVVKSAPEAQVEFVFILDTDEKLAFFELNELCKTENLGHYKILLCSDRNPGSSRNMGIKAAEGKWIIFCDSDDMPLFSNLLTSVINANNQCDIVIGSFVTEDRLGIQSAASLIEGDPTFNWDSISLNPGLWRWLIQKKLLEHISFPDLSLGEDQFFLMRLLLTTSQIQFSSLIFYVYRSEIEGNLTSNKAKILDLSRNLELEISYLRAINSRNTVITNMLFRQIVTLFKRGSIRLKLYAVLICIRLFLLHSPSEVLSVMKFAVLIIKGHN